MCVGVFVVKKYTKSGIFTKLRIELNCIFTLAQVKKREDKSYK